MTTARVAGPRKTLKDFVEGLRRGGYVVRLDAKVAGKSGVVHRFDLVAERGEERGTKTVVCMRERGKNPVEEMIGLFAMAFDVGAEPCYITRGSVDGSIVQRYGITLLENE